MDSYNFWWFGEADAAQKALAQGSSSSSTPRHNTLSEAFDEKHPEKSSQQKGKKSAKKPKKQPAEMSGALQETFTGRNGSA